MHKIEYWRRKVLGVPMTPSQWVGEPEYKHYLEVMMSCGGGTIWYEYVVMPPEGIPSLPSIIEVKTIEGPTIYLNTASLVRAEKVRVMKVTYNSQNPYYKQGINTELWIVPEDRDIVLSPEFRNTIKD